MALNIQSDQGRSLLKRLLAEADVFVTNVRLQSLQKLGLDYDSLKDEFPRLVYGQLSAWGLQGEMVKDPGYDFGGKRSSSLNFALLLPKRPQQLLRSLLGIQRRDGRDPLERDGGHAPFPRCYRRLHDSDAAVPMGIAFALYDRHTTGVGQMVDAALLRSGIMALAHPIMSYAADPESNKRLRSATMEAGKRRTQLTSGCFRCADDRWVYLLGNEQFRHWDKTMCALTAPPAPFAYALSVAC